MIPPVRVECRFCDSGEFFGECVPLDWFDVVKVRQPSDGDVHWTHIGTCPDCKADHWDER